ncbi:MAG: glycerate kinase [Clostridia bacterium]|nr:glycerate kinase [Clostridia bacterium]
MKVAVAIDSFKGSLSSVQAGEAVRKAILRVDPDATVYVLPLADGGEGTVEALCSGSGGQIVVTQVTGPLGAPVTARFGILPDKVTAVIEMASAAGITLVPSEMRDPMVTTTYGVGELIREAIHRGCRRFLIGIGGSATNDGGVGMLQALGFDFTDEEGRSITFGAAGLEKLHSISNKNALPALQNCQFRIACDVGNPLCGKNGCSAVFSLQKGASPGDVPKMDKWLSNYAAIASAINPDADPDAPGAGAAGGSGFAFMTFTNAKLESGVQLVINEANLEEYIREADIVVTGEGRLDGQTVMGKAPVGIASLAKKYGKRVIAFSGCVSDDAILCNDYGIDAFFPILRNICTLEEALDSEYAAHNLAETAYQVFRLLNSNSKK